MRVAWAWVLVSALGCGSKEQPKRQDVPSPVGGSNEPALEPENPAQPPPDFAEARRSLEWQRTGGVRLEPGDDAKRIGTVAVDTRVGWDRTAPGKGCQKPWVQI